MSDERSSAFLHLLWFTIGYRYTTGLDKMIPINAF
jgi:hypothetical protein